MSANDLETSASLGDLDRETADLPLTARKLGGRYRVIRELGQGGMGRVFEVLSDDGRRLAAKLIAMERTDDPTAVERFFREARAAQSIESRHVVRTFELGLDDHSGSPFIVMELLEGIDLRTVVEERAPLGSQTVARIGVQAAQGLCAAHATGIVHRDVKPSNVFLQREGHELVVKVCDFGIAKQLEQAPGAGELTHSGGLLGSPRYMSPEQAKSARRVDARTDVWSLCATLYAAASGREPWADRSTLGELIVAICTEPIAPLSEVAPWIEPDLARTIERGLERDPDRRWRSMQELAGRLEGFTGGQPGLTESDLARVEPRARRPLAWRIPVAAAIVVGGAIAALLFASRNSPDPEPPEPSAPSAPALKAEPRATPAASHEAVPAEPTRPSAPPPPPKLPARSSAAPPAPAAPPASATGAFAPPSAAPAPLAPKDEW